MLFKERIRPNSYIFSSIITLRDGISINEEKNYEMSLSYILNDSKCSDEINLEILIYNSDLESNKFQLIYKDNTVKDQNEKWNEENLCFKLNTGNYKVKNKNFKKYYLIK